MTAPDLCPAPSPEDGVIMPEGLDSLPPLANERLPEDFNMGEKVLFLFNRSWMDEPKWVKGEVTDIVTFDMPLALRLPLGIDSDKLIAQAMEESDGQVEEYLKKDPNPEPLRQVILNSPDLREHMPSPGFVSIKTAQNMDNPTGRVIGIDMNLRTLIPASVLPHLKTERFRDLWLADGVPDGLIDRIMLEQAIKIGERIAATDESESHEARRARKHSLAKSGKVGIRRTNRRVAMLDS